MDLVDHSQFFVQAANFKRQAMDQRIFTRKDIAAMLGSYVLVCYQQTFAGGAALPPEFMEMLTKQNTLTDWHLSQMRDEEPPKGIDEP